MISKSQDLKFEKYVQEYQNDPEFIADGLAVDIIEQLLALLKKKGLTQSWLAEQMDVSKAHISKLLSAPPNMTLITLAKIASALGVSPKVQLDVQPCSTSIDFPSFVLGSKFETPKKTEIPSVFLDWPFSGKEFESLKEINAKEIHIDAVGVSYKVGQPITA